MNRIIFSWAIISLFLFTACTSALPITPTNTLAPTLTFTSTTEPTLTATNTPMTPTATNTALPPTSTPTETPIPPTLTNTPIPEGMPLPGFWQFEDHGKNATYWVTFEIIYRDNSVYVHFITPANVTISCGNGRIGFILITEDFSPEGTAIVDGGFEIRTDVGVIRGKVISSNSITGTWAVPKFCEVGWSAKPMEGTPTATP